MANTQLKLTKNYARLELANVYANDDADFIEPVALFTEKYADKIVDFVESGGGGGGGGGTGDVTQSQLNAEIQARKDGDATLTTNLNKEISDRKNADAELQTNIDNEANSRKINDDAIRENLSHETEARVDMDNTLQSHIDNEKSARESADTALQAKIDAEKTARENADTNIINNMTHFNPVFKDVSTDSYSYLKNLKVTFKPGVMILQGDIYPLATASSNYALDPYQLFLGVTWKVKLTAVLNSKTETLETIIKSYEPLTDFSKLQAYGGGEDNTVTMFNTTIPSGAGAVNGRFSCGCKYFYSTLTTEKEIVFFVSYNLLKVDAEKKHTFDNEQLKKYFRCPFTLVIPLVKK